MIAPDMIRDFVIAGHFNLDKVQSMLVETPELLNLAHDWGEGDTTETALQAAGHMGNRPIAEFLLAKGAEPDLFVRAMLGERDTVSAALAAKPALANARGTHHISLMFHVALSGDVSLAQVLKDYGVETKPLNEAVHAAVTYEHVDMLRWLLNNGVDDVNTPNYEGNTPLAVATEKGHVELIALLREQGGSEA